MEELRPQLWRWTTRHPDWRPDLPDESEYWGPDVSSVLWTGGGAAVLIDPLVGDDATWRAIDDEVERVGAPPHVLLSIVWHDRSSAEVLRRYPGARLWAHRLTVEAAQEPLGETDTFEFGAELPGGVVALEVGRGGEALFWIEARRTLFVGDVLLGDERGGLSFLPEEWLAPRDPQTVRTHVRRALDRPIELVVPAHGLPLADDAHGACDRALAS